MGYWYAIGPVAQSTDAVDGTYFHAPDKCIGWIDTRPTTPGSVASGFFAFSEYPAHLKETHAIVGDGNRLEEYYPTALERSAWETMYGVKTDPAWTLVQALRQLLFVDADPEGAARCLPGTPTHRGVLELHLGGHSRVWAERFTGRDHDAWPVLQRLQTANLARLIAEQTAEADRIRRAKPTDDLGKRIAEIVSKRLGKASYAEVREELAKAAEALPGKALTNVCRKYRCDPKDVLPVGVEVERRKPETSYSDDFNRSDGALGSPWSNVRGTCVVASNEIKGGNNGTFPRFSFYNQALSSADMKAEVDFLTDAGSLGFIAGAVRCNGNNSGNGYYAMERAGSSIRSIRKLVDGTSTEITGNSNGSGPPKRVGISADGSTLTLLVAGQNVLQATDTSLSGIYCAGVAGHSTNLFTGDNWAAEDLLAAAVVIPVPLLMLRA